MIRIKEQAKLLALSSMVIGAVLFSVPAQAIVKLHPGNQNSEQPAIPGASKNRTKALKSSFDKKYNKVVRLLRNDKKLISDIKSISRKFGIDPIHMVGAIVGEHTYNVDALDRAQSYYVKALAYVKSDIDFEYDGETISEFVEKPQFEACDKLSTSLKIWTCREHVWDKKFRGKKVDGKAYPNNRFSAVFFQPFYAGQTFGIGQLNPLTALMMTDHVSSVTGAKKIDVTDGKEVYGTIMDPKKTLPYIAATLASSIEAYRDYAGFDISDNPGITATLYNTGSPIARAQALLRKNKRRMRAGKSLIKPQENYYGWLINDREDELRSLF